MKTLGNYTHFLVYTASSLVEQSTPYALEIFDEFASAPWFGGFSFWMKGLDVKIWEVVHLKGSK